MRKIIILLLLIATGYIGFQKFIRNPKIEAGNLEEIMIYGPNGKDLKVSFKVEIADDP